MMRTTFTLVLLAMAFGATARATVDEQVVVYFNAPVLELPDIGAQVAPSGLASCHPELLATMTANGVDLVLRAVPGFDLADTLLTTPGGLEVKMPHLERLYVLHTAGSQRDALVDALRTHPFVVFAEKDVGAVPRLIPNDPRFWLQWAVNDQAAGTASPLADIRAIDAWDITQGSSDVTIGIQDPYNPVWGGGRVWDEHPDLQGRVSGELSAPIGEHATVVAGVAAARGNNGQGIAGVDWNARIVTRTHYGAGELIDDLYYMISHGVDVVNHSWGQWPCEYNAAYSWAGALAYKANLLNVVAMPEDQNSCIFPNAYPWQGLNVGATTALARRAEYSHPHPFIDVAAPGGDLDLEDGRIYTTSTQPPNDPYVWAYGTSLAAPHVTGAASLLKAYDPSLYNDDLAHLIRYSADDLNKENNPGFDQYLGWGRLNVHAALLRLRNPYSLVHKSANGGTVYQALPADAYHFVDMPAGYPDGMYIATPVEVRRTVAFNALYAVPPRVWGRGVETVGYANMTPNFTFGWCEPVGAVGKTGCTLRTYVFELYTVGGEPVGWFPTQASNVKFAYTVNGIQDVEPPLTALYSPNGGETFQAGGNTTIQWHVADEYLEGVRCSILLDLWTESWTTSWMIAQDQPVDGNGNASYGWTIDPGMLGGNTYKIRVIAYDTNDHQGVDVSDAYFTIEPWTGKGGPPPPPPPCEEPCGISPRPPVYVTDLLPVSPNPFNPETRLRFTLANTHEVTLRVYDVQGRLVRTVIDGVQGQGMNEIPWDGTDANGRPLPSGVYFAALSADRRVFTQKLLILK
jgi:hypothetical protein